MSIASPLIALIDDIGNFRIQHTGIFNAATWAVSPQELPESPDRPFSGIELAANREKMGFIMLPEKFVDLADTHICNIFIVKQVSHITPLMRREAADIPQIPHGNVSA